MAKKDVDIYLNAHDRLTKNFRQASGAGQGLSRTIGRLAGVAAGFVGFRAIAGQTIDAIRESVIFEKQLAEISTMLDGPATETMARYKDEIKIMAIEFGQSKETLSKGLYDILSSGIAAGDGLTVLRVAAKAAIGGVTDTAVAVDALTTVLNAYGLGAESATKVSDLMFNTVKEGKIVYSQLAEQIGKIAPSAKAAGVPIEELFGMLSTMVKIEKPERAFTALRAALMTSAKEGKNFLEVVRSMKDANLTEVLGAGFEIRAAAGVAILTGNWRELEEQIIKAHNSAGKADIAFQKMADTNYQKISKLGKVWKNLKGWIGDSVMEYEDVQIVLEGIVDMTEKLQRYKSGAGVEKAMLDKMLGELGKLGGGFAAMLPKAAPEKAKTTWDLISPQQRIDWMRVTLGRIFAPFVEAPKGFGTFGATAVSKALGAPAPEKTTEEQNLVLTKMLKELQRINKNTEVKVEGRSFK